MRAAHGEVLIFRVPVGMRAALVGAARENGTKLSAVARDALSAGLQVLSQPQPGTERRASSADLPSAA